MSLFSVEIATEDQYYSGYITQPEGWFLAAVSFSENGSFLYINGTLSGNVTPIERQNARQNTGECAPTPFLLSLSLSLSLSPRPPLSLSKRQPSDLGSVT